MGIYNRDYMRADGGGNKTVQIPGPASWSAITWLVVINVIVFLAQHLFLQPELAQGESPRGGLEKDTILKGQVWGIVTHLFVHGSLMHLFFNMFMLVMFGRFLQNAIGSKRFLKVYFTAGILSGLIALAAQWSTNTYSVGASGAVMAVAIASCFAFGEMPIRLLIPPVTLKFRTIGYVIIGFEIFRLILMLTTGKTSLEANEPAVGVVAHLVGIVIGYIYVKFILDMGYRDSYSMAGGGGFPTREPRRVKERKPKPVKQKPFIAKDVDAILDKINEKGFQSLTDEEKRILDSRSEELHNKGRK